MCGESKKGGCCGGMKSSCTSEKKCKCDKSCGCTCNGCRCTTGTKKTDTNDACCLKNACKSCK